MIAVMAVLMLLPLLAVFFFISRQDIPGNEMEIMGVRSVFPAGRHAPVAAAKNGWQGFAFSGNFRFFRRSSEHALDDHQKLKRENFPATRLQAELDLFDGGFYALRKAGKGYRLACIFHRGDTNYWADMVSANSMDFSRRVFERFILNLQIAGERVSPRVAGQIAVLSGKISPLLMQTPDTLLGMMVAGFVLALLIAYLSNRFSGSCPRRSDPDTGACTPYATLRVGGFGRRKLTACCLRQEGDQLVIYRFRRPYKKIAIAAARQEIIWETSSFRYQNLRIILPYNDFQRWRAVLMA
jgi:hypothetical protein